MDGRHVRKRAESGKPKKTHSEEMELEVKDEKESAIWT